MTTSARSLRSRFIAVLAGIALAAFTLAAAPTDAGSLSAHVKYGASGQAYAWQAGSC